MSKWRSVSLQGHIQESTLRKGSTPAEMLSVTNTDGFVRSLDVFDKQVFSKDASNYKLVKYDDLAYNPSRVNVGSVARCDLREGGAVSPMYVVVRCRPTLSSKYLLYFLKSDVGRAHIAHRAIGAVRFMLRFSDLAQMEVPMPPRAEQDRLVKVLEEVTALKRFRAAADSRTRVLSEAVLREMFGNPVTNERGWPSQSLGELQTLMEYGPRFYNEAYSSEGTRIVRITDIDEFGNLCFDDMPRMDVDRQTVAARRLQVGDFIFARSGATAGKVALFPKGGPPCIAGAYFIRFRLNDRVLPEFALELLRSEPIQHIIQQQGRQAAQPNFSGPLLRALQIILPPVKSQRTFVGRLAEIRGLQEKQARSRERLESLFDAVLSRALTEGI
jgi:type I restriction enzyme, S subunit